MATPSEGPPLAQVFPSGPPQALPVIRVPPAKPRFPGGTEFYGPIPKNSTTFTWSEICATPGPEASLAPVPQVAMKSWYNTYVYTPEQTSHEDRRFLQRFTQGPDGEWVDVVKARRLNKYMEESRLKQMREAMEKDLVSSGAATRTTHYVDPYTGEKLVACRGQLLPEQTLYAEYDIHKRNSLTAEPWFDFDNLRINWPFDAPDRNKIVSQHTYDWFDRRNMYITSDKSVELVELDSMYLEKTELERWWHSNPGNATQLLSSSPLPQPSVQQVVL
jgi:hypothetical protein